MSAATLDRLAAWLHAELQEAAPVKRAGPPGVTRLALALEPADVPDVLNADALFLHRSRHAGDRWPGLGLLGAHDGFDRHLTTGPNVRLARRLSWQDLTEITWAGRVVGLSARPPQRTWEGLRDALHAELGGEEASIPPGLPGLPYVALMNAMTPALIAQAAGLGVTAYLTGQLRPSAVPAARQHGMGIVALGHRRTELWGLRALARELRAAFPGLQTAVFEDRNVPPTVR